MIVILPLDFKKWPTKIVWNFDTNISKFCCSILIIRKLVMLSFFMLSFLELLSDSQFLVHYDWFYC